MRSNFGANLRQLMKLARLSQQDVANQIGVSRPLISTWVRDANTPDIYQARSLARLFGVSMDSLIDGDPAKIKPGYLRIIA